MKNANWTLAVMLLAVLCACGRAQTGSVWAGPLDAAPPPTPVAPMRISAGVMGGMIATRVDPVYPAEAKAQGIQGAVVLHAIIGKDGSIENLAAISGPEMLQAAAIEAVRQWTYKPYLLDGQPTAVDTTIVVNFHLTS